MKAIKITLLLTLMVAGTTSLTFAQETRVEVETREAERARALDLRAPAYVVAPMQRQSSELSFSKRFDNESIDSEKSFIINKDAENISLSLSGTAMEGNIKLTLISPDGKEYQVLEIDNSSDLRWRQSFTLGEDTEKLVGKWKIKIKAENASGNYMFRMVSQ
jgi:hypothetical protein